MRSGGDEVDDERRGAAAAPTPPAPTQVFTVRRAHGDGAPSLDDLAPRTVRGFNRWNAGGTAAPVADIARASAPPASASRRRPDGSRPPSAGHRHVQPSSSTSRSRPAAAAPPTSPAPSTPRAASCSSCASAWRSSACAWSRSTSSTSGKPSPASVHPREVARHHPEGEAAVFSDDRGSAVTRDGARVRALRADAARPRRHHLGRRLRRHVAGHRAACARCRSACPKVMVSTMASGDTRPYVGPSDICMMYSVTDVQGIHRISEQVLANAAHALAGMIAHPPAGARPPPSRRSGLTMFGVTTPCVQAVTKRLEADYDCLVFHATGVGGQSMEKLAESGLLAGVIDVSTTEIADEIGGGVLSAGPTRLDVFARHPLPYVGSCGALDMVNFGAWDTVPERFKGRRLYRHNPTVTLMRTTADECRAIGEFIADKLNAMTRPGALPDPRGRRLGDRPAGPAVPRPRGRPRAVRQRSSATFRAGADRKLQRLPLHINDEAFADALVAAWREIAVARRCRAAAASTATNAMPRIARQTCSTRLRAKIAARPADHRRRRRHRPVGQVRGGRRHRPDRDLQLGPLPHGRARLAGRPARLRQRQRDRLRDGARGAAGGQAHAGARRRQRHRSVHDRRRVPAAADRASASPACRTSRPSA